MRYELDANGYVLKVFWGCNSGNCTEYTGKVPSGYKNLTEWSENALINAYYIVDGNLVLDSDKLAELQAIIEQETIDNTPVFYKDIYGTNEVLDSQYQSKTASGQVIAVDNVKRVNPKVKITDIKCYDYDKVDIISQNKNMLSIDTPNEVVKGIKFTKGANGSLNISGKVYKDMPMVEGEENNYSIEGSPTIECTYKNLSNENTTKSDTSLKIEDGKEINSFKVYGKSEQATRSGKNVAKISTHQDTGKYSYDKFEYNNISVTKTATGGQFFAAYSIDIKQTGTYTFSGNANFSASRMLFYAYSDKLWGTSIGQYILTKTGEFEFDLTFNSTGKFLIGLYGDEAIETTYQMQDFMCRLSTITDKTYEPYGASPSPDYPSEINSISGIENLLNINTFVKGRLDNGILGYETGTSEMIIENNSISYTTTSKYRGVVSDFIPVNANTTYYLFGEESVDGYEYIDVYNSSKTWISRQSGTRFNKEFTTPSNASYIRFSSQFPSTGTHTISNVMITTSSKNNYVPYGRYLRIDNVGKNLLGLKDKSTTSYGLTYSILDNEITINGTATASDRLVLDELINPIKFDSSTKYRISIVSSGSVSKTNWSIQIRTSNSNIFTAEYDGLMKTSYRILDKNDIATHLGLYIGSGTTFTNFKIKVQVEKGETATEYEEYRNDVTYVNLAKENLFDKNDANILNLYPTATYSNSASYQSICIEIEPNTTYTLTSLNHYSDGLTLGTSEEYPVVGGVVTNRLSVATTQNNITITSGSNDKYLLAYIKWGSSIEQEILDGIKIYEGSSPKDYYDLCSIGDTKDELEVVSGKGVKKIGEVILNGSEGWVFEGSATTPTNRTVIALRKGFGNGNFISSHFIKDSTTSNKLVINTSTYISLDDTIAGITSEDTNSVKLTKIKTWLSNNPVTVKYELATPEEFEIEPTDSTETTKYNLSGSSTNTTSIFALKKNENYYLNVDNLDCEMNYYDGTTSQVYTGASGLINLSENKEVTQVVIKLPTYATINKTIYPQLEYGSVGTECEEHKERRITINFSEFISSDFIPVNDTLYCSEDLYLKGTTIDYIYIEDGKVYISVDGVSKYLMTGNVNLFNGYNTVYPMQDANIEMIYSTDEMTGNFTGNVYSSEGNKVVSKYGVLTNLQFIGNSYNWYGQHNIDSAGAWFLGFNTELTGMNWANFIKADAYIPEGFKVTEATITVVHKPVLWGDSGETTGYCKNIEAYKVSNIESSTILAAYCSEYDVTSGYTFSKINNAMGTGGHTFNPSIVETFVSNDISDAFEDKNGNTISGNYQIAIKTSDKVPTYSDNPNYKLGKDTGHVFMVLNIIGYMPNKTNK